MKNRFVTCEGGRRRHHKGQTGLVLFLMAPIAMCALFTSHALAGQAVAKFHVGLRIVRHADTAARSETRRAIQKADQPAPASDAPVMKVSIPVTSASGSNGGAFIRLVYVY